MAKTKALIDCAVTAQLIFVFAEAKIWFSHDAAHISLIIKFCLVLKGFSTLKQEKIQKKVVFCFDMLSKKVCLPFRSK